METEKVKDLLYRCNDLIPEKEIRKYVRDIFDKADKKFFEAPASSSGKHHPPENNIIGGLTGAHTIKVALYGHDFSAHTLPESKGVIVAACLLHDIRKGFADGKNWTGYAPNHAFQAYEWLDKFDLKPEYKNPIRDCIRTHMGILTEPEEEKKLSTGDLGLHQRIVQYADIAASLKWASFIPGVNVRGLLEIKVISSDGVIDKLMNLDNLEKAIDCLWKNK